ncbi:hypothetical protein [Aquabacterium humicola]|nr:hypothetical protein [Rubrivivax pictus]
MNSADDLGTASEDPSGREVQCWHTDIYQQQSGTWRAVWSQATELRPRAG